jgi:hypothetical protein
MTLDSIIVDPLGFDSSADVLQGLRVIVNIASVAGVEPMKSACACECLSDTAQSGGANWQFGDAAKRHADIVNITAGIATMQMPPRNGD